MVSIQHIYIYIHTHKCKYLKLLGVVCGLGLEIHRLTACLAHKWGLLGLEQV